jgi:hypothetical protein
MPTCALSARWIHRHQHVETAENVVVFFNKRGTVEQWIKEGDRSATRCRAKCRATENKGNEKSRASQR